MNRNRTRWDDTQLNARFFWRTTSWPTPDSDSGKCLQWQRSREHLEFLRSSVKRFDAAVGAVYSNDNLSESGQRRREFELGIEALNEISSSRSLTVAQKYLKEHIAKIEGRMRVMPPFDPAERIAFELKINRIQDFIRDTPKLERKTFVMQHLDEAMYHAVFNGTPAYLVGLTRSDVDELRDHARQALWPEETREIGLLRDAFETLEKATRSAESLIAERVSAERDSEGRWGPKQRPGMAPTPLPSRRPGSLAQTPGQA